MKRTVLATGIFLISGLAANAQIAASIESPQCYEGVGCPHKDPIADAQLKDFSCDNLWLVRNTIFHQRGYCFSTARGMKEFSNKNCSSKNVAELKLGAVEKANIATIEKAEKAKGCN